jgi:excisionase family DNA binding protein
MPKSGEFYSFDEVLKRLKIDDQRLKKLVSEGEIRAFREGSEMKFRRADIDTMDRTRPVAGREEATAAIDLSAGGGGGQSETLTDDLIFDEGDDVGSKEAGMATAEISSQDTFVDEGVGMSTEPLEGDESTQEVAPAGGRKGGGKPKASGAPAVKPRVARVE